MATITSDRQSFQIDGRRIWLVSGAIHYPRVPRELWRDRIAAAKQAGLNCIETYVFWNYHQPTPNGFDFTGNADLRHFVKLIDEAGMYCILRPGPYVCAEWDFGGLPPWLTTVDGMTLRYVTGKTKEDQPFMAACASYLGAVMEQVRDLQATESDGGPIVMIQAENEWCCHNPEQGERYLRQIVRFLEENGCTVPINECNNLWQPVEGAISTWNANTHLAADLRQLRLVQPNVPRIVTEYWPGWFDQWGRKHHTDFDAELNLYRMAQMLAAGAQYNLYMFHGGTNFGFYGGRSVASPDCFMTTSYDYDAPLLEAGGRGQKYAVVKRISTFASQFGNVLANLQSEQPHAAIAPDEGMHPASVIHQSGSRGDVVFILKGQKDRTSHVNLLLPNGMTLPVPLGADRAAWLLLEADLGGGNTLTYTNLRPWALVDEQLLILFGPAKSQGLVCINGAQLAVTVPSGRKPAVERHEELTVVVMNTEQVDSAYLVAGGVAIDTARLDLEGQPVPIGSGATVIHATGEQTTVRGSGSSRPRAPRPGGWTVADQAELVGGDDEVYQPIDGPATLEALECPYGYGWYRLELAAPADGELLAPEAADRVHVFTAGVRTATLGLAPGATFEPVSLRLEETNTMLVDNLGRMNFGWSVGEKKGIWGDLHEVEPVKLGKPKTQTAQAPDVFELGGYFQNVRRGDRPDTQRFTFKLKPKSGMPMILDVHGLPAPAMVLMGEQPLAAYHPVHSAGYLRRVLTSETIAAGHGELTIALLAEGDDRINPLKHMTLYQTRSLVTRNAAWSFAPWTMPDDEAFKTLSDGARPDLPCWYRTRFNVSSVACPLWLEPRGMSKGQIYLNGHNLGRYFVATSRGKAVPPQQRYYLPEPWLKTDAPNELTLFDEHGKSPTHCRLAYSEMGPYGK